MRRLLLSLTGILLLAAGSGPARAAAGLPLPPEERALLEDTFAAIERGDWATARQRVRDAHGPVPVKLVEWLYLFHGNGSFDELTRFIVRNPDWPLLSRLARKAELALPDGEPLGRVSAWFARYPAQTGPGMARHVAALFAEGEAAAARDLLRRAWREADLDAATARRLLADYREHLTKDDHVARLDRLLWNDDPGAGQRMLDLVPDGERALARARIALAASAAGVDTLVARVPDRLAGDGGLTFERARWRRLKDRYVDAAELLQAAPDRPGPRPDRWWRERRIVAAEMLKRGFISESYRVAARHGLAAGGSEFADAEWMAGWIALRFLGDVRNAYQHFAGAYEAVGYPISKSRFAYWAGRAAAAQGDAKASAGWYARAGGFPDTFYGQLAVEALGRQELLRFPGDPVPTAADRERFAARELPEAMRLLAAFGRDRDLLNFALRLNEIVQGPGERALAVSFTSLIAPPPVAVRTAKHSSWNGVSLYGAAFPVVVRPGKQAANEPALLLSIARQESEFDAGAISRADARGLMQLLPGTARETAQVIGVPWRPELLTTDPIYNMKLGDGFLNTLVGRYDGSYVLAVAAYNAGPARIAEWIRLYGDPRDPEVDEIDWIESIPFGETRNYVQRVLEGLQVYRYRLDAGLGQEQRPIRLRSDLRRGAFGRNGGGQG